MANSRDNQTIGLLLQRKNILNPIVQNFRTELLLYLLEAQIMLQTIQQLKNKNLIALDGLVGDRKCQTRASMLLDLFTNETSLFKDIQNTESDLIPLSIKIQNILTNFDCVNYQKQLVSSRYSSMINFITNLQLFFVPSSNLILASLCFLTKLSKTEIHCLSLNKISKQKIDTFVEMAKIKLCQLSIEYEQKLALDYSSKEEQIILTQIETKKYSAGFSSMTAFFPSFIAIFNKMKKNEQSLGLQLTFFCLCGGIRKRITKLFQANNLKFSEELNFPSSKQIVMIMECYQFPGSFAQIKQTLEVSELMTTVIPQKYYHACACTNPTQSVPVDSIETAIKAVFAQHPQFTNGASIDWYGLGLIDSYLKKEFDYLNSLPGYSIDNLSIFLITHVYASTIEQALKQNPINND